tara:strand:+ start:1566 stop:2324 length:759 start_codon:yes stop_codon:yes gene_type:complete
MKLRVLTTDIVDPYLNFSLEKILHEKCISTNELIIRFWKNDKSIIMGRTQHIEKEVNLKFCKDNNIEIVRRHSGGGTVFNDLGNLNTTFILPIKLLRGRYVSEFSIEIREKMMRALVDIGIKSIVSEGISNIFIGEKKISGSAGHLKKGWFLHHATLLIESDLKILNKSILARENNPKGKNESRYFETTNLVDRFDFEFLKYKESIVNSLEMQHDLKVENSQITEDEMNNAKQLKEKLFKNYEWIFHGKRKL